MTYQSCYSLTLKALVFSNRPVHLLVFIGFVVGIFAEVTAAGADERTRKNDNMKTSECHPFWIGRGNWTDPIRKQNTFRG